MRIRVAGTAAGDPESYEGVAAGDFGIDIASSNRSTTSRYTRDSPRGGRASPLIGSRKIV